MSESPAKAGVVATCAFHVASGDAWAQTHSGDYWSVQLWLSHLFMLYHGNWSSVRRDWWLNNRVDNEEGGVPPDDPTEWETFHRHVQGPVRTFPVGLHGWEHTGEVAWLYPELYNALKIPQENTLHQGVKHIPAALVVKSFSWFAICFFWEEAASTAIQWGNCRFHSPA